MRSVSLALAALIGAAAANPVVEWPRHPAYPVYPTGGSSSSSSLQTSSASSSSSATSSGYPVSSSSVSSSSSSKPSYLPTGYTTTDETTIYTTETVCPVTKTYGTETITTSTTSTITITSCKGGCHKPTPTPTGYVTDTTTIYTTETVCPVTKTYGTQIITTLTTSTITITSCKGGCHKPTETPTPIVYPTGPAGPAGPITIPQTITTTSFVFVPCSTSVGKNGNSIIYSTYLSTSAITKTYTTDYVIYPTPSIPIIPGGPIITPAVPNYNNCPAPVTVTNTVTLTIVAQPPSPCKECIKTYTVTESGSTKIITVTDYPTYSPVSPVYPGSTSDKGKPPVGTGTGYPVYPSESSVKYPTASASSSGKIAPTGGPKPTGYAPGYGNY